MQIDLTGKAALVTGGGRGIGRGIATALAQNGARVLIATRTAASGQAVVDELNAAGGEARLLPADLSSREACEAAVGAAAEAFGALDILVHNSAIFPFTLMEQLTDEEFDRTLRTNLYSAMWLGRAALPHLKASGQGRVVLISSVVGNHSAMPGMCGYAASKGGLNGLGRNMAGEFAKHRVTVNIIEPGLTIDDRAPRMDRATRDAIVAGIPLGREGFPNDIAAAALFFVSPAAGYVTGQVLIVDGGHTLIDRSASAMAGRL